jgi:hypothetical protein
MSPGNHADGSGEDPKLRLADGATVESDWHRKEEMMSGRTGLAGLALLVVVGLLVSAAAASVPTSGQYGMRARGATVQVLPGGKSAYVILSGKSGAGYVDVTLPAAVKITNGGFSYIGKAFWASALLPTKKLPATATITGKFPTPKTITLTYSVKQGLNRLAQTGLKLTLWTESQT